MKSVAIVSAGVLLAAGGGTVVYEALQPSSSATGIQREFRRYGRPVDMRIRWQTGKKYAMRLELNQQSVTKVPNQPEPTKSGS